MTYFHTDQPAVIDQLARMLAHAHETGKRVRLDVDSAGRLKWKCGEGGWTFPHDSTPDPYRDPVYPYVVCSKHRNAHKAQPSCVDQRQVVIGNA